MSMNIKTLLPKYKATLAYVITIVIVNMLFSYLPYVHFLGDQVSPADMIVGMIYITRDFAQREIGHRVAIAMVIGALLSYLLAEPVVATASVVAFIVGESIEWMLFTLTRQPLSQRLLWSAGICAPIDTFVFFWMLGNLNPSEFTIMSLAKLMGVVIVWWVWKVKNRDLSDRYHHSIHPAVKKI